jgi:hypothetical protein
MFFEISKNSNTQFTKNYEIKKGIFLNCDLGWSEIFFKNCKVFFKGYISEKEDLNEILKKIIIDPTPKYQGNFFCIIVNEEKITITNSYNRGSPLWFTQGELITNLFQQTTSVWADKIINIDNNLKIIENIFKPYTVNTDAIEYNSAIALIHEKICNSFENFLQKNKNPIKIFLSGGIDTLTCYSYLKKFTKNFEIVDYEYKKFTHFYRNNLKYLKSFWGYNQMHTWGEIPTTLVTGGCGDEFFLRGPATCNLLLLHHKLDLFKLLEKNKNCYHYWYFNVKNKVIFENQKNDKNLQHDILVDRYKSFDYILNNLVNDHQHWHIDETIFFTPFKDIQITEIIMRLDKDALTDQILNAGFNKELICKNNPNDLKLLSKQKNFNHLENLHIRK